MAASPTEWHSDGQFRSDGNCCRDWLDAYRAKELNRLVSLYDDQATHACGCDGQMLVSDGEAVSLAYGTPQGVVQASLSFNENGKIAHVICGHARRKRE